jgi:hypothetical protein
VYLAGLLRTRTTPSPPVLVTRRATTVESTVTTPDVHVRSESSAIPSVNLAVVIAPPSTPDKSYFAAVTIEHRPGTRLAEYDREQTSVMHELEINNPRQEDLSGDSEARPSTASSVIDLNGLPDVRPWQPRDSFQTWIASTVNIAHPHIRREVPASKPINGLSDWDKLERMWKNAWQSVARCFSRVRSSMKFNFFQCV